MKSSDVQSDLEIQEGWDERRAILPQSTAIRKAAFLLKVHKLRKGYPSGSLLSLSYSRPSTSFPIVLPGSSLSPLILSPYCMQGGFNQSNVFT